MATLATPEPRIEPVAAPRPGPIHHVLSTVAAIIAVLIGLLVLAYVLLFITKGRFLKHPFETYASRYADRPVRVAGDFQLYLNPHIRFYAEGLSVANPAWAKDRQLFTARRIDTEVGIWNLVRGERRVRYLFLDSGTVGAEIDAQGRNTWTFASDEPFKFPAIDRASITGTTAHFIDARQRVDGRFAIGDVAAVNSRDTGTPTVAGPITFTGAGTALDSPFTLRGALATPNAMTAGQRFGLEAHLAAADSVAEVSGTLAGLNGFEGADLKFSGAGKSLQTVAALFGKRAPDAAFRASGTVKPAADGRTRVAVVARAIGTSIDADATLRSFDTIDGAEFRVNAVGGNLADIATLFAIRAPVTPFKVKATLVPARGGGRRLELTADAAQTDIAVSGVIPDSERIDGTPLKVSASGQNLQTAFKLFGLVSPATRPYRIAATMTKTAKLYRFAGMSGRIGGSDIAGRMSVDLAGAKPQLDADLHTKLLDILDIGPLIGYSPVALDAKGGAAVIRKVNGTPRIIPDAPLAIEQLKAFNASVRYTADRISTGSAKLTNLALTLTLQDSDLHLKPAAFDIFGGRLTSDIDLDARVRPVVTTYDIRMSRVPLGQLLTSFDVEKSGTTASVFGRIQLKGYGDTMRESLASANGRMALVFPAGTLWVRNIELGKLDLQNYISSGLLAKLKKPQEIRCGVVAFTVKDGVAAADPILFDTRRANFRGRGNLSFKDESLNLSVLGDSKEFSLFSGQSPVGIGGHFAAPSIKPISKQLLARAGAGIGLGLLTGGPGAILAFVDIGDAKNANCEAVEAAAPAKVVDAAPHDPKVKRKK